MTTQHTRRTVIGYAAATGVAAPLLAACGSDDEPSPAADASPSAGSTLTAAGDVPVGGGVILKDQKVVVTQPTKGDFKAFSAVCTHSGCLVGAVEDEQIRCPCHGSKYSITDGSVLDGPAPKPLPPVAVAVKGGEVVSA